MYITKHAIRRFKARFGHKTTSRKRVVTQVTKELRTDIRYKKQSRVPGYYILVTSKFQAVCRGKHVITIMPLNEDATNVSSKTIEADAVRQHA